MPELGLMSDQMDVTSRHWDVIIVGTGVGGATVGHSLALAGLNVLFLEKGGRIEASDKSDSAITPNDRIANGWWPFPVTRLHTNGTRDRKSTRLNSSHSS